MNEKMNEFMKLTKSENILLFEPGETEYERSVATPNQLYRFSRPDCVVQPETISHVQTIVQQAKLRGLTITIKNGGHSYAGFSTAFKGISLDLTKMREVKLDIKTRTVTLDGGAQWAHAYKKLINGRYDRYMINGGRCPSVGVSGFILGGGLGPFTRSLGMGCDALKEATIVTADGKLVTVKDSDDPLSANGRLFWALCGAGGGNFGVLVKMKMKVQKLQNKTGLVVAGRYTWFPKSSSEAMDDFTDTMIRFYTTKWPNQMTIDSTWLCNLRDRQTTSDFAVRFLIYYDGNKDEFDDLIDKHIRYKELAKQLKRRSLPEKSTRFLHETLVAQWSEEIMKSFPTNKTYSISTSFIFNNDLDGIHNITAIIREEMKAFRSRFTGEQVQLQVTWIHSGGKASEKEPSDTAFRWRDGVYPTYAMIEWDDKWMEKDMRGFLQELKNKLRPFSLQGEASFINFPDGAFSTFAHERAYYGDNYEELRRIKDIWDKDNFFNWSQGIKLSQSTADGERIPQEPTAITNEENLTDSIAGTQWEHMEFKNFAGELQELAEFGF
ncbi:hypothetical protein NHQ30_008633 [Ciborinia camelliae]|nr:hypothetical protein NHQ30_008633 [Ciborinia camelliae]